jgi:hypothetical protein
VFQQISNFFTQFKSNADRDLKIDEKAISRLLLESNKRGIELYLEIHVKRDHSGKGSVHIGFSQMDETRNLHPKLGAFISPEDYLSLACGVISYSQEEGSYVFYPNIDLVWFATPNAAIKKIRANKPFTRGKNEWFSDKNANSLPIKQILNRDDVVSCYANGFDFQIEFTNADISESVEAEISEHLLTYLSFLYLPLDAG